MWKVSGLRGLSFPRFRLRARSRSTSATRYKLDRRDKATILFISKLFKSFFYFLVYLPYYNKISLHSMHKFHFSQFYGLTGYWLVFVKLWEFSLCGVCVCDYLAKEKSLMSTIITWNDLYWVALKEWKVSGLHGLSFPRFRLRVLKTRLSIN